MGAGANVLRNLLLLCNEFPLKTLLEQYPNNSSLLGWIDRENKLRNWKAVYGFDISNDLTNFQETVNIENSIFINHSAFYQTSELLSIIKKFNVIYLTPHTKIGLLWQVRAYAEKKGIANLHNFTFSNNVNSNIKQLKELKGIEYWHQINLNNMYHVFRERRVKFYLFAKKHNISILPLEKMLYNSKHNFLYNTLLKITKCKPIINNFNAVITAWLNLHWETSNTKKWKWTKTTTQ